MFDIINSSIIQQGLGTSKKDLAKRVNFLIELNKLRKINFIKAKSRSKSKSKPVSISSGKKNIKSNSSTSKIQPKSPINRRKVLL